MPAGFDPALTRQIHVALGPLFGAQVRSPAATERFADIGFDRDDLADRYYAFRSAQLGRATVETVIAAYFNFAPRQIRQFIPRVWDIAEPTVVLDALMDSVDAGMGGSLGDLAGSPELLELAALLRDASATAFERPEGRPLFTGIAAIPWPEAPHAQVWLGMHALREFRGDGHIAALMSHELTGIEAVALHAGAGGFPPGYLRAARGWTPEEWDATVDDLRGRGLIAPDEEVLSESGTAFREVIETQTDELAMPAYSGIGERGVTRILELAPPIVDAMTKSAGSV
jgi:hypothetical protein